MVDENDYWQLKYAEAEVDADAARNRLFKSLGGSLKNSGGMWYCEVDGNFLGHDKTPYGALIEFEKVYYKGKIK